MSSTDKEEATNLSILLLLPMLYIMLVYDVFLFSNSEMLSLMTALLMVIPFVIAFANFLNKLISI